jgi:hypothetical protein
MLFAQQRLTNINRLANAATADRQRLVVPCFPPGVWCGSSGVSRHPLDDFA